MLPLLRQPPESIVVQRTENFKQQNGKGGHVAALRIKRDNP
jgi:hypothetical protein